MPSLETPTLVDSDFQYIRQLVRQKSGITLEGDKAYLVEARMLMLLKKVKIQSISELVSRSRADKQMEREVVNMMTTNETSFFRDSHPFEILKKQLFANVLQKRAATKTINFWCAACSSGQEPYSLSMIIKENFPTLTDWKINILATDLSSDILNKAREGMYTQLEVNRGLPMPLLVKYFKKTGSEWQIKKEIRDMVEFREFNLIEPWPLLPKMDFVFLRNVLIYFDVPTKKQILDNISNVINPDGVLFLGGSETTLNLGVKFKYISEGGSSYYVPGPPVPIFNEEKANAR